MTTMFNQVEQLSKFDLQPVLDMVKHLAKKLMPIDVESVKQPLETFAGSAMEGVDVLAKTAQGPRWEALVLRRCW